jgi:hypothetical protein
MVRSDAFAFLSGAVLGGVLVDALDHGALLDGRELHLPMVVVSGVLLCGYTVALVRRHVRARVLREAKA